MISPGRASGPRALLGLLRSNRLLHYNAIYLTGSLVAGAGGYVFHFATGRLLGPAQYAVVASAVASLYLLNLPALVVQTVSARFTSVAAGRDQLGNVPGLLLQLSGLGLGAGILVASALVTFRVPLSAYLQVSDGRVIYALAAASLLSLLVSVTRGALQGLRRFVALSINVVLDMTVRVAGSVAMILGGLGALGGVLALLAGPAAAYVESLFLFKALRGESLGDRAALSQVGRYAAMTTIAAVGTTYLYNADVVLSKHYLVAHSAGIYAAASVLGRVVYFLGITVAQVMFPEVATLHAKDRPHFHVVDVSLSLVAACGVGLTALYALAPGLVLLPYGNAFNPVRQYLWPFALALGLLAISNLLITYFLSIGSSRFAIPLIGACLLETGLIAAFHAAVGQILLMVVISVTVLAAVLSLMYGLQRFDVRVLPGRLPSS